MPRGHAAVWAHPSASPTPSAHLQQDCAVAGRLSRRDGRGCAAQHASSEEGTEVSGSDGCAQCVACVILCRVQPRHAVSAENAKANGSPSQPELPGFIVDFIARGVKPKDAPSPDDHNIAVQVTSKSVVMLSAGLVARRAVV